MIKNRDIIVMSSDWGRHPGPIQHITELFARRNRVLWVSGIPIRGPRPRLRDLQRIVEKGRKMFATYTDTHTRPIPVTEIHPFFVPFYDLASVRRYNDRMLKSAVVKKVEELSFHDYILFPTNPMTAGVVGRLGESSSHYLCIDDYGANEGAFRCLGRLEGEMLQKVDSSWSMSDVLFKTRIPKSGENHFFPEGVDLEHFKSGKPLPEALAEIKRPIVGYAGLLASWVDFRLIVQCAKAYPDVSFVILGAAKVDISMLTKEPNIHCLGHVPYELLPHYLEAFDVGLIPRRINRLTVAMNPLKLLEYMAMGMPVVSTNLPEVKKLGELVYVAEESEQFVRFLGEALKDNAPERKRARRAVAERFSWHSIAERISDVVLRIENTKRSAAARSAAPIPS
jgi:glycosyltransferase involved in cell wall biosynthesis